MADWKKIGKGIVYSLFTLGGVLAVVGVVKGCSCQSSDKSVRRVVKGIGKDNYYSQIPNSDFIISSSENDNVEEEGGRKEFVYETEINNHVLRYEEHEKGFFDREPYNVLRVKVNGEGYDLYDSENAISIFSSYDFRKDKLEEVVAKGERHGNIYRSSSGEDSDYSRNVKKAFHEWNRFYANARVAIVNELKEEGRLNEQKENGQKSEEENKKLDDLYNSFDVFDSK